MEAKTEILAEAGKSSFIELTLPSAVTRFRQGIGRLIRSQTDVGDLPFHGFADSNEEIWVTIFI